MRDVAPIVLHDFLGVNTGQLIPEGQKDVPENARHAQSQGERYEQEEKERPWFTS